MGRSRACRPTTLAVLALGLLLACACTPPLVLQAPLRFFALGLPQTAAPADTDGKAVYGVYRSVRLLLEDRPQKHTHTITGDMDQGQLLEPGHRLGMVFNAPRGFSGVAVSLSRAGPGPTNVRLTLRRGGRQGAVVAMRDLANIPQRGWAEVPAAGELAGTYYVELDNASGQGLYWRGNDITPNTNLWQGFRERAVPFRLPQTLAGIPSFDNGSYSILVNTPVERIFVLGGRSTYDNGIAAWGDYEALGDTTDRQFIGDKSGEMEVIYTDGSKDVAPLMFGLNQWWWKHWGDVASGGPFVEPFAGAPRRLIASLHVYSLDNSPLAPSFWVYQPQKNKTVALIRFIDNREIQGFPLIAAVTIEARQSGPNASLLASPSDTGNLSEWLTANTLTAEHISSGAYENDVAALRSALYARPGSLPAQPPPLRSEGRQGPLLRFEGTAAAAVLSNVYEASLADLRSKLEADGSFHTSSRNAPNYGLYGGIGTWRDGVGYFYDQAWSRDVGRSLLELIRLGFLDAVQPGLDMAAHHLYDLPNLFPQINRNGRRVPAHWGTVLNVPNYIDVDGMGDDNQENDGHGLLLLSFVRSWQELGRPADWLERYWQVVTDAAEWYCYQIDNPAFSRATGVLYTEGEAANDGGYDVYSNQIAVEALRGSADMARARADATLAARWTACADRLSSAMLRELTDRDGRYGVTWRPVAWDWGYGHESLAPAFISADRTGYTVVETSTLVITTQTYRRQVEQLSGFRSGRILGYGQAFLTQAALILDDMAGASEALQAMAGFIYDADLGAYLVPEGVALAPSGAFWYRTGDLGNAMQESEVLKTLALIAGIDDMNSDGLVIIPRLPDRWTGIVVSEYPVTVDEQRVMVSYELRREGQRLRLHVKLDRPVAHLAIRLGPVALDAEPSLSVDGIDIAAEAAASGGANWLWLRDLSGKQDIQLDVIW